MAYGSAARRVPLPRAGRREEGAAGGGEEGMAYANLITLTCFDWTLNLTSRECHILLLHVPLSLGCSPALNARGYRDGENTHFLIKESFGNARCDCAASVLPFLDAARLAMTSATQILNKGMTNLSKQNFDW